MNAVIPQALIFSTQRSGTHLLESFLSNHPQIHKQGEVFDRHIKLGQFPSNVDGKLNIGILMYNQIISFNNLGGDLNKCKIIHLLRTPKDVAMSRLQALADKQFYGKIYKAHLLLGQTARVKAVPDFSQLSELTQEIDQEQKKYIKMLKGINHLQLSYEDFAPRDISVSYLNKDVRDRVFSFLDLAMLDIKCSTDFVRTGINLPLDHILTDHE